MVIGVLDHLLGLSAGEVRCSTAGSLQNLGSGAAVEEACTGSSLMAALERVGIAFVEAADSGQGSDVGFTDSVADTVVGAACPGLTVHEDTGIDLVNSRTPFFDGGSVEATHQVETEAVNMILIDPIKQRILDVLAGHRLLGGQNIAQTRTVVVGVACHVGHTIEVFRNGLGERRTLTNEGVVVNNVHDNGDTAVMQCLNQHLEFLDTGVAVIRIRRIRTLGNIVVLRIITPVALGLVIGLIDGSEVLDGHELYAVDVVLYEIVNTGSDLALAVNGGVALGEREVLTAVRLTDAGGNVDREITNVDLPNDRLAGVVEQHVAVLIPTDRVGGVQVNYHGTVAVSADALCVRVNGLADNAVAGDEIGVIGVLEVAGLSKRPDTGGAVVGHSGGAENGSA